MIPTDNLFTSQWYLNPNSPLNLGVTDIWNDYTGAGVKIAIIDDGFDLNHVDLIGQFNVSLDYDYVQYDETPQAITGNNHGTAVAGIIGAANNGTGIVGIAYDAELIGLRIGFGSNSTPQMFQYALIYAREFDVINNSWGFTIPFADDFNDPAYQIYANGIQNAALLGRGGLGSIIVFAAGNTGSLGDNTNYHDVSNSPYAITVGAVNESGNLVSYSTPGASVLVAAPGFNIRTTDGTGALGYNSADYITGNGTSFATGMVSGVAALMLQANPDLSYRNVQEILAHSARKVGNGTDWQTNGAGLHFSHSYGFGMVDAYAAVRLAETWDTHTPGISPIIMGASQSAIPIPDDGASHATSTITINNNMLIERVEVTVDITHANASQLDVILISPDGTRSILADNAPHTAEFPTFTFDTVANWGEESQGEWTLEIYDRLEGTAGTLNSWSLDFIGSAIRPDTTYIYTNEYAGGTTLNDNNGSDTINAAAINGDAFINLAGTGGSLGGKAIIIANTSIENIFTGDGNDIVTGSSADNNINTGRGNDTIHGSLGDDIINGGAGADLYIAHEALNHTITVNGNYDITLTSNADGHTTRLINVENFLFGNTLHTLQNIAPNAIPQSITSITYFVYGDAGVAQRVSDSIGNHAYTTSQLGVGGAGVVLLADRSDDHLSLTNNAGENLNKVSMLLDDGLSLSLTGFNEVNVVANGTSDTTIDIGGGQRGFIQSGSGNDTIEFTAFLINQNASAQDRTLTANTGDGNDHVIIDDRSHYLTYDIDLGAGNDTFTAKGSTSGTVHGDLGADIFEFGLNSSTTVIDDFSVSQGDKIDISALIDAHNGNDPITNFVMLTTSQGNTNLVVEGATVATLQGTLLTDTLQHYIDTNVIVID